MKNQIKNILLNFLRERVSLNDAVNELEDLSKNNTSFLLREYNKFLDKKNKYTSHLEEDGLYIIKTFGYYEKVKILELTKTTVSYIFFESKHKENRIARDLIRDFEKKIIEVL